VGANQVFALRGCSSNAGRVFHHGRLSVGLSGQIQIPQDSLACKFFIGDTAREHYVGANVLGNVLYEITKTGQTLFSETQLAKFDGTNDALPVYLGVRVIPLPWATQNASS